MKGIVKNDVIRLCVSLFLIAAIVALALGGVNALTKDRIAELEKETELETVRQYYDYDAVFEKAALDDGTEYFIAYKPAGAETPQEAPQTEPESSETPDESSEGPDGTESSDGSEGSVPDESVPESSTEPAAEPAPADGKGELLGYAVTVSENGYGGEIKMLVCFDKYGKVNGMGVISMSETSGVGTRITGEGFFDQFTGKIGPFKFVKGTVSRKNDIAAISGASISSKAAVGAVNKAYTLLSDLFIEG